MAKRGDLERSLKDLDALRDRGVITEEEHQQRRAALINAPLAAAPAKRGGIFRTVGIGCGALVLGVVVLGVIVALVGSGNDEETTGGSTTTSVQIGTNPGDVHVPLAVNSSGEIAPEGNDGRRSKVTILEITDNARSTNQFSQPAAGKKYWAVQVQVEATGSQEVTSLDWKLRDSKDFENDRRFVAGLGESLDAGGLTPGGRRQGWVVFEIDADAGPKWLRADPNPFLKNDLYFDAQ